MCLSESEGETIKMQATPFFSATPAPASSPLRPDRPGDRAQPWTHRDADARVEGFSTGKQRADGRKKQEQAMKQSWPARRTGRGGDMLCLVSTDLRFVRTVLGAGQLGAVGVSCAAPESDACPPGQPGLLQCSIFLRYTQGSTSSNSNNIL